MLWPRSFTQLKCYLSRRPSVGWFINISLFAECCDPLTFFLRKRASASSHLLLLLLNNVSIFLLNITFSIIFCSCSSCFLPQLNKIPVFCKVPRLIAETRLTSPPGSNKELWFFFWLECWESSSFLGSAERDLFAFPVAYQMSPF